MAAGEQALISMSNGKMRMTAENPLRFNLAYPTLVPHSWQNFAPASSFAPHSVQ
jgi:hypothetical protein